MTPSITTSEDWVSFLQEMVTEVDSMAGATVEAFAHPTAPGAVAKARTTQDGVDYTFHQYVLGFTPAPVLAGVGAGVREPEADIASAEEILRTIRVS